MIAAARNGPLPLARLVSNLTLPLVCAFPVHADFAAYPECISQDDTGFALAAPAKINLALRVIGRRADGYHEIETLFQEISLCDRLEFRPATEWRLAINGTDLDSGETNLITRAARLLSETAGVPCHAHLALDKRIPIGGGLGGGSSDAAVALIGLSRLWGLDWGIERLLPLAVRLGSDCAFFLYGGLVHGSGRGERLEPQEGCLEGILVLVVPSFGINTAWAYEAGGFPLTDERKSVILLFRSKDYLSLSGCSSLLRNDLENIVLRKHAELGLVKRKLQNFGAEGSLLSGSGSVVYGIFTDSAQAEHAAQQFGQPYRVIICRAVSRARRTNGRA